MATREQGCGNRQSGHLQHDGPSPIRRPKGLLLMRNIIRSWMQIGLKHMNTGRFTKGHMHARTHTHTLTYETIHNHLRTTHTRYDYYVWLKKRLKLCFSGLLLNITWLNMLSSSFYVFSCFLSPSLFFFVLSCSFIVVCHSFFFFFHFFFHFFFFFCFVRVRLPTSVFSVLR